MKNIFSTNNVTSVLLILILTQVVGCASSMSVVLTKDDVSGKDIVTVKDNRPAEDKIFKQDYDNYLLYFTDENIEPSLITYFKWSLENHLPDTLNKNDHIFVELDKLQIVDYYGGRMSEIATISVDHKGDLTFQHGRKADNDKMICILKGKLENVAFSVSAETPYDIGGAPPSFSQEWHNAAKKALDDAIKKMINSTITTE